MIASVSKTVPHVKVSYGRPGSPYDLLERNWNKLILGYFMDDQGCHKYRIS